MNGSFSMQNEMVPSNEQEEKQDVQQDVRLRKGEAARRKLIKAGIKLFAMYGYDSTSTRMIVKEAGVNLSSISFYFSGKEALYSVCLRYIADKAEAIYRDVFQRAEELLEKDSVPEAEAKSLISEIMCIQLSIAFGRKYHSSLRLVYWEQRDSMAQEHPITTVVYERIEQIVARLLSASTGIEFKRALLASRFLNGSVIAFGEHSLLVKYSLGLEVSNVSELPEWVRAQIAGHVKLLIDSLFNGAVNASWDK